MAALLGLEECERTGAVRLDLLRHRATGLNDLLVLCHGKSTSRFCRFLANCSQLGFQPQSSVPWKFSVINPKVLLAPIHFLPNMVAIHQTPHLDGVPFLTKHEPGYSSDVQGPSEGMPLYRYQGLKRLAW